MTKTGENGTAAEAAKKFRGHKPLDVSLFDCVGQLCGHPHTPGIVYTRDQVEALKKLPQAKIPD